MVSTHKSATEHKKIISSTAIGTLEAYAVCGIRMAGEFVAEIKAARPDQKSAIIPNTGAAANPETAAILRARYLGADIMARKLFSNGRFKTVVERAAGMYPFGFNMTNDLPVSYIETDISQDFDFKPELCAKIARNYNIKPRGTLQFSRMDAITLEGIDAVTRIMGKNKGPIAIIDAGLMVYQTEEGFEKYVDAAKKLLMLRKDSIWIATDMAIRTREFVEPYIGYIPYIRGYFERLKENLGVDYQKFFPNGRKLAEFLMDKGFDLQRYSPRNLDYDIRFTGIEKSSVPEAQLNRYIEHLNDKFSTMVLHIRK